MKKNLIAVLMVLAVFGVRAEGENLVYSSNAHAVVKVNTASTNVLIAVPWTFYTPTGSSDIDLPINRLVKPEGLDDGDVLLNVTQSNPQKYQAWMLTKTGGIGNWEPVVTVEKGNADLISGLVQKEQQISKTLADAEDPVQRGIGLWLVRKNPKDGDNWKPVYLYGQWTEAPAEVSVAGGAGVTNSVMIAYPACTKEIKVNEDMTWDFVGEQDTLSIPNGGDAWDMAVWDAAVGKWCVAKTERVVIKQSGAMKIWGNKTTRNYDLSIPAGHGFWYIRRDVAGDCKISWPK